VATLSPQKIAAPWRVSWSAGEAHRDTDQLLVTECFGFRVTRRPTPRPVATAWTSSRVGWWGSSGRTFRSGPDPDHNAAFNFGQVTRAQTTSGRRGSRLESSGSTTVGWDTVVQPDEMGGPRWQLLRTARRRATLKLLTYQRLRYSNPTSLTSSSTIRTRGEPFGIPPPLKLLTGRSARRPRGRTSTHVRRRGTPSGLAW
jgi:hypothetical protein